MPTVNDPNVNCTASGYVKSSASKEGARSAENYDAYSLAFLVHFPLIFTSFSISFCFHFSQN